MGGPISSRLASSYARAIAVLLLVAGCDSVLQDELRNDQDRLNPRGDTGTPVNLAEVALAPSPVAFPSTSVGDTSIERVTLRNRSQRDIEFGQVVLLPAGVFRLLNNVDREAFKAGLVLEPGEDYVFEVLFEPQEGGSVGGTLELPMDGVTIKSVRLEGTGS